MYHHMLSGARVMLPQMVVAPEHIVSLPTSPAVFFAVSRSLSHLLAYFEVFLKQDPQKAAVEPYSVPVSISLTVL